MENKPIPILGVLILNGPHWLKRQIESVDYPVENYLIINVETILEKFRMVFYWKKIAKSFSLNSLKSYFCRG